MTVQIGNILIWQKNGDLRNLEFERDTVNVITGESGKGKSSILHIIDYCLLSSKADGISKANIDDKSSWYGLRLHTSTGLVTIARPAYHCGEASTLYFSDQGVIPELPEHNMNVSSLKNVLDKAFGLDSDLKVPYGGRTIKAGSKVSFRNFLSYCYQDQNAIVAPDYLYNRSSDLKVIERIERTFRMALGIVDTKGAIVTERLEKLRGDRLSIERRSELIRKKRLEFQEDVISLEEEAISLGLIDSPNEDVQVSLRVLKEVANSSIDRFDNVGKQLKVLETRQLELNRKLRQFKKFNEDYQAVLKASDDSIRPVTYLVERYREILPGTKTNEILHALESQLTLIKQSWKERNQSLLYVDVNEQTKVFEAELESLCIKMDGLKVLSKGLSSPKEIYRYQGKLSVKVDLYSDQVTPIDYSDRILDIDTKIEQLNGVVQDIESKREFVMGKLNKKINEHLSRLKLKGYELSQAVFIERERAINLILNEGESIEKMIDIGSASNYLYLHLSYFMALHEVARENNVSWMPRFLVLDQVSTPYTGENSNDISSLDLALKEIDMFVESMKSKGGIQVILMEHIPESHWLDLKLANFSLVDRELINGYGLIN
ncbi:hypothetical protein AYY26_17800 [Photobacterium phosphoreum]|uniref:DUF3732 domain-containing protein n=1 Tax=Photobacterium phosphoreum TaxID=659 RepID=UPI0007F952AB|nr:DUF3732 domain-containing protein [Photobacterium phosphoreum]OBU44234.1 hypothetical protein AYY26_17800 [Photobacterium phosphoreum]